jgi:hypothetical protein
MTRVDNSHYLHQAAVARHHGSVTRTREALQEFDRTGRTVTMAAVARAAGVSRSWLYSEPKLREAIAQLRASSTADHRSGLPLSQRPTPESTQRCLDGTRQEITRLRAENAILREQLARSLGDARANH